MVANYWQDSRAPRYSVLVALPLFLFYQILVAIPARGAQGLRNGADVLLQLPFLWVAGTRGPLLFTACLLAVGGWLVWRDVMRHRGGWRPVVVALMLGEAAALAIVFGVVVSTLTVHLVPPAAALGARISDSLSVGTRLMLSLGAGLYEELLFRVILVGSLAWAGRRFLALRPLVAGIWATLIGALIFSAFHYIGPYGDTLRVYSFVFRTIAGLAFSALYLLRGFGVTAWTHALYDTFLILR